MLRLPSRTTFRLAVVLAALALAACGVKGPLVPAKRTPEAAPPPPPATTAPEIPSATPPAHPTPAP